jgi:hypothetical protein
MLSKVLEWLDSHWLGGGGVLLAALLIMLPVMVAHFSSAELVIVVSVTLYLIHQIEEHANDAFRLYINNALANGADALTPRGVMLINVGFVWLLSGMCLAATAFWSADFALVPVYLMAVNAVVHVIAALVRRQYNPGLGTALTLFLPFCFAALWLLTPARTASLAALLAAVAAHAAIAISVRARSARIGKLSVRPHNKLIPQQKSGASQKSREWR